MRIDAHQHFWHYAAADYPWIGPGMAALARDHLPADLAPALAAREFDGCIAVQARSSRAETDFLLALAERHEFVRGVVGWLDLCAPDAPTAVAGLARQPRLRGLRHIVQDEPDDQFLARPDFRRGVAALAAHDLVYDVLIHPRHLRAAAAFCAALPDVRFVLDHLAKPCIARGEHQPWADELRQLARLPNVHCKVSGLVTEARWHAWRQDDFTFYLDTALAAFGPERLLFGSDWPVCLLAARDHAEVHDLVAAWANRLTPHERAGLFGGNAVHLYQLS